MRQQWWVDAHEFLSIPCAPQADIERTKIFTDLISIRTLFITLASSFICLLLFLALGLTTEFTVYLLLIYALFSIAIIDHETLFIPDIIVIPMLWAGLLYAALTEPGQLQAHVFGAVIGYCLLRWLPVGEGDAKLSAAAGAWLGTQSLFTYFMIGSVCGVLVGLGYYLVRGRSEPCPFGPSLVAGFFVTIAMNFMNFQPLKLW